MSDSSGPGRTKDARVVGALRLAVLSTGLAVLLALVLLIKETAYTFVVFTFLGPFLLLLGVLLLGWAAVSELRRKKVL